MYDLSLSLDIAEAKEAMADKRRELDELTIKIDAMEASQGRRTRARGTANHGKGQQR